VLRLAWFVGQTNLRIGKDPADAPPVVPAHYRPWYASQFTDIDERHRLLARPLTDLRRATQRFSDCFHDQTLPAEVIEAVAANLTILKSPTVMRHSTAGSGLGRLQRQFRLLSRLLHPRLELRPGHPAPVPRPRTHPARNRVRPIPGSPIGHQTFRSALPIRPVEPDFHAAADGQLGGIMKVHRDWRISGDTEWLRTLWPRVRQSLDYCITWDPATRAGSRNRTTTPTTSSSGDPTACAPASTSARSGRRRADGPGPQRRRATYADLLAKGTALSRNCSTASTSSRKSSGKTCGPRTRSSQEHGRQLFARSLRAPREGRPEIPIRHRLPRRRRARLVAGRGLRRRAILDQAKRLQPSPRRSPAQSQAGPLRPRQPAAARLCLRRRRRAPALHLAEGRPAVAAVRLFGRSLDRDRIPGRVAPHADGPGRGGTRDRPGLPRPLRRPHPQPVQRIRMRPLVRPGHVFLRACSRA
jgi:hypothetical protein